MRSQPGAWNGIDGGLGDRLEPPSRPSREDDSPSPFEPESPFFSDPDWPPLLFCASDFRAALPALPSDWSERWPFSPDEPPFDEDLPFEPDPDRPAAFPPSRPWPFVFWEAFGSSAFPEPSDSPCPC
jgi:hypothetical protein